MKHRIDSMDDKLNDIDEKLDSLMLKLLDPDTGLVVRTNKNTKRLDDRDKDMPMWMSEIDEFRHMKRWQGNMTKAIWGIYGIILSYIAKNLWW